MLKELKRKSMRSIRVLVILCLVISFALFFTVLWEGYSFLLKGKVNMDTMLDEDIGECYVDASIYGIYECYAYTTETKKHSLPETTSKEYIIPFGDFSFIGMAVQSKYITKCDTLMETTWDYLDYKIDEIPRDQQMKFSGTIRPMDAETLKFYQEFVGWDELDEESRAYFLPYYLDVDSLGSVRYSEFFLINIVVAVLLIAAFWMLGKAMTGQYQSMLKDYVKSSMIGEQAATSKLELFYQSTKPIADVRINQEFIMFQNGAKTILIPADRMLWAYQQTTTHRTYGIQTGKSYSILLKTKDGKQYGVNVGNTEVACQEFLVILHQNMPHVLLGYRDDLQRIYKNDRTQMIQISDKLLQESQGIRVEETFEEQLEVTQQTAQTEPSRNTEDTKTEESQTEESQSEGQSEFSMDGYEMGWSETVPDDDPFASVLNKKR